MVHLVRCSEVILRVANSRISACAVGSWVCATWLVASAQDRSILHDDAGERTAAFFSVGARQPDRAFDEVHPGLWIDFLAIPYVGIVRRVAPQGSSLAQRFFNAAMTWSTIASALARISSSVASWIGCGTNTRCTSGRPRATACFSAASTNTSEAITTEGLRLTSNHTESCTLHVVHDPQSASASITKSLSSAIRRRSSSGAGLVNVGLR